jgi:ribonucleoside-diphosphate reductase beta chain
MILDSHNGMELTLRPMKYPQFYDYYKNAIKNTWTVEEVKLGRDLHDLKYKLAEGERHMVSRLVAFFATGDEIVSNNLVLNLYKHVNSPEARLYYSRQLFEESVHVDQYLKLVEEYIPDEAERRAAFNAVNDIPAIKRKAEFCQKWIDSMLDVDIIRTNEDKRKFLMVLITFAAAVEGLFFMGAFAYVYYLRSRGLLPGLGEATNWIFRDESMHMDVAFLVVDTVRQEQPELFTDELEVQVREMLAEAISVEMDFADDTLDFGILGFTKNDMRQFLQFCADLRLTRLGYAKQYNVTNPFGFMTLQEVQSLTNFFEKTVAEYQSGITGDVAFDEEF